MASLIFKNAEVAKDAIMASQKKEIAALYEKWADEIGERAKFYSHKSTASSVVSERQMKELQKMLRTTGQQVSNEIYGKIKNNIYTISDAVVADNIKWLKSFGFSEDGLNAAFNYVPDNVVRNLLTGQIYDSGWSLSKRIWGDNEATLKDTYQIMARGLAQNKPIYEIAKDLENYVRPSVKKNWNPILAMKNTKTGKTEYKRIYKKQVDYNAQRLARTLVQHGYQQSFIATTQKNPFITEYIWHSNGSRVCPICLDRDGATFQKDALPMDHPNGMCTMEPVVAKDMVDQLADWFNSPDGTYPEIDAFASNFGYEAKKGGTINDYLAKYGKSDKTLSAWKQSMSPIQKAEAKLLKDAEGLTWENFYAKHVYSGDASDVVEHQAKVKAAKAAKKAEKKAETTIKAFNEAQGKYLKPYGFTPKNMPVDFDDWSHKISHSQASEILQSMGTSWGDPHPYQQLMKYYNANLASTSLVDTGIKKVASKAVSKVDDVATVAKAKNATKAAKAAKTTDNTFDAAKWSEAVKANDVNSMHKWTDDWLKIVSDAERGSVNVYTSSAYHDMNSYLRGIRGSTSYKDEIKACQSALSKASLPQETVVRRGSNYNMLTELGMGNITSDNKDRVIGAIVQDKGFLSTSPDSHGGFSESIEYIIKVPEGSQAMYIAPISEFKNEKELLINCGGKFMVEDVEFDSYGSVNKIYMTLKNLR